MAASLMAAHLMAASLMAAHLMPHAFATLTVDNWTILILTTRVLGGGVCEFRRHPETHT